MPLRSSNAQPVCRDIEPLLITGLDDVPQVVAAELSCDVALIDQFINADPALGVEGEADRIRLVAQDEG